MTNDGIASVVKKARKTAKLTRHITPHILRHTGASYDGSYLTEQDLCLKYGWVVGSDMARRYCHTSENRLAERLKKIAGVKDDEETERRCPRCGEKNSVHAENCSRCNQILDYKRLMDEVEKKKDMSDEIIKLKEQVSHLLHGFDGCYFKDGKSTPIYETEAWQIQLKKIMREHYHFHINKQ